LPRLRSSLCRIGSPFRCQPRPHRAGPNRPGRRRWRAGARGAAISDAWPAKQPRCRRQTSRLLGEHDRTAFASSRVRALGSPSRAVRGESDPGEWSRSADQHRRPRSRGAAGSGKSDIFARKRRRSATDRPDCRRRSRTKQACERLWGHAATVYWRDPHSDFQLRPRSRCRAKVRRRLERRQSGVEAVEASDSSDCSRFERGSAEATHRR
jgi:hypothetical protein